MKVIKHILLAALGSISFCGNAQVADTAKPAPMTVMASAPAASDTTLHVYAPASVKNTEQKIYDYQRYNHGLSPGFRVQIDFGQQKNAVSKTQSDFSGKFPGVPSYLTYKQPYFRVSVGDFRSKLEAVSFLNKVRKNYPGAFVVADKIVPPPLVQ